jgi:radical SAM/Cys-rich protein
VSAVATDDGRARAAHSRATCATAARFRARIGPDKDVAVGLARSDDFEAALARHGVGELRRGELRTLQVNVGKLCNQACHHCHVDAGPRRTEIMTADTAERALAVLERNACLDTLDLTGGAPELNPSFRRFVERATALGRDVVVRCNLTVTLVDGMGWLPEFYRAHGVRLVCSLPCYTEANVDKQRGGGVFDGSVRALRRLNALGYGQPDSSLRLDLVYNPLGAFLPGPQAELEAQYREQLDRHFGIAFHGLLTLTNMPIARFGEQLRRAGDWDRYMGLLVNHFNAATVPGLMCRHLVSVGWDGRLSDCDFNQMLDLPLGAPGARTIWDLEDVRMLADARIATGPHCFGCTAGAGSSCGGALV